MRTHHVVTAVVATFIIALAVWAGLIWGTMKLGQAAYDRGDYRGAEEHFRTAERISPFDRWQPDFGLGTSLLAQGEIDPAITALEEALETVPEADVVDGVKDPNSYECRVRANLYVGYAEAGRDDDAIAVIETCPNPDPSATDSEDDDGDGDDGDDGEDGDDGDDGGDEGDDGGGDGDDDRDPRLEDLEQRGREGREQRQNDQEWGTGGGSGENW